MALARKMEITRGLMPLAPTPTSIFFSMAIERTLCIIKPDAVSAGNIGNIIAQIQKEGFRILGMKMVRLSRTAAEKFYEVHRGRPFFEGLVEFMSSAACVPIALVRENAIAEWRRVIGSTDPA